MFDPKFVFFNDLKKEANYLCFLAKNISLFRYQNGNFLVLPYPVKVIKSVYFPNLPYQSSFWNLIKKEKNEDYGKFYSDKLIKIALELLKKSVDKENKKTESFLSVWEKNKKIFLKKINQFYSGKIFDKIKKVEILLTNFGTYGSFNIIKEKKYWKISCTQRLDLSVSNLLRTIILALCYFEDKTKSEIGEIAWYEKQKAVDYLINHGSLKKFFNKSCEKIKNDSKAYYYYQRKSNQYLTQLGFNKIDKINIYNHFLVVNSIKTKIYLTSLEERVLKCLIENRGNIVTFDDLGQVSWQKKFLDKFSLYAIAKVIENIRKKICQAGLNYDLIKTVRKRGYYFI